MATVIDTLIVALGLDASKFTAGVNKASKDEDKLTSSTAKLSKETDKASKAANNHGKELAQMAGQGVKAFNDMRTAAVSMFASYLTASGIEKLIVNLTSADAKLGYLAKSTGQSAEEIKAWSNAAEQAGGSAEGMQASMSKVSSSVSDFVTGRGGVDFVSYLSRMGMAIDSTSLQSMKYSDVLLALAKTQKEKGITDANMANSMRAQGFDEGSINLVLQGTDALKANYAAQKENAAAAAANTAKSAELAKATASLKQKFEAVGNEVLGKLTPSLIMLAGWMERNSGTVTVLAVAIGGLVVSLTAMSIVTTTVSVVSSFIAVIKKVSMVTRVWTALQWLLNAALTANPIGAVIMAIALLAAGVYYAYSHFDSFKNGVDGAWEKLKSFATGIKNDIKPVFDWLGDVMSKIMAGDFKGVLVMLGKGVVDVTTRAVKAVVSSDAGKAVKQAATDAHAGYREVSTGEKTEGANQTGAAYKAGQFVGNVSNIGTRKGLRIKGREDNNGGMLHNAGYALAHWAQANIPNFERVSAGNDEYHHGIRRDKNGKAYYKPLGYHSVHVDGRAVDFTLKSGKKTSAAAANKIRSLIEKSGAKGFYVRDEYLHPSKKATAGHIHTDFKTKEAADKFYQFLAGAGKVAVTAIETVSEKFKIKGLTPERLKKTFDVDDRLGVKRGSTAGQIYQESKFNPNAKSGAGASGFAQIMPATRKTLERRVGRALDPSNYDDSLLMLETLMKENLKRFGSYADALRAYNGGWDKSKWDNKENKGYVGKVAEGRNTVLNAAISASRQQIPTGAQLSSPVVTKNQQNNQRPSTSTSEVHIQNQVINTQATDAKGIIASIQGVWRDQLIMQHDNGLMA